VRPDLARFQRRAEADAVLVHYDKMTLQIFNKAALGQKALQHNHYFRSGEMVRNAQQDDTAILLADLGKLASIRKRIES
jgi:hypothetical protein